MARRALFSGDEDGGFSKRPTADEGDVDITPMIDMTFLLLIFFMVTSNMQTQKALNIPAAEHGEGVPARACTEIIVLAPASAAEAPKVLLGELNGPQATLEEMRHFVEKGVRAGNRDVVIKADRDVPHGFVQRVLKIVTEIEGVQFSIGVQDRKS